MTRRQDLIALLSAGPRTASSVAHELGLDRRHIEDEIQHIIRTARAAGHDVVVEPARCKNCGFLFAETKLTKPSKCPACRGTRVFEPLLQVKPR